MKSTTKLFTTMALLSVAGIAQAQIALDDWTSFNSTSSMFNGTFNGSASDKIVIVATGEHGFNNDQGNLNSITYDGVSFVKAIDRDAQFAQTDTIYADIWYLDDPGTFHTAGLIEVNATTRANITVLGLSGTAAGVGNVGVTPTDTRSINLNTSAESFVVASFSMGGAGNTANVTSVSTDSPLTQIAALENGSNWDGQVVGYENNTTAGTQSYSFTGGNTDGSLVIAAEFLLGPPPALITLRANTTNGVMTMIGDGDDPISFNYYEINSAGGSLATSGWNSLADQDYDGNGPANGSGNGWEEAGGSDSEILSEAYLLDNSTIAANQTIQLGTAYNTVVGAQDLTMRYLTDQGKIRNALVEYFNPLMGDADNNGIVEFPDFVTLSNNYSGATTGQAWEDGDFDGDGDVAFGDFVLLSNNWGANSAAPDSAQADVASAVNAGEAKLIVGADGSLTIEGGNVDLNGYSITSASGLLNPDGDNNSSPFTFYISNSATDVTAGNLGTFANVDGLLVLDASVNPADLQNLDLVFQYGTAAGSQTGDVEVVPEPTSLALLGLGGLLIARRRRD